MIAEFYLILATHSLLDLKNDLVTSHSRVPFFVVNYNQIANFITFYICAK
jgi:hypothetical protein